MAQEIIPDIILERVADLWARKLSGRPEFNNGDDSTAGGFTAALATMNSERDRSSVADYSATVQAFRDILLRNMKATQSDKGYLSTYHSVDYHPDKILSDAAQEAGLPLSQFPVKSTISFWTDNVSTSFGYGAPSVYHVPLPDGSGWIISDFNPGSKADGKLVVAAVMSGALPLKVEKTIQN